jgi:hypothetical protein
MLQGFHTNSTNSNTGTSSNLLQDFNTNFRVGLVPVLLLVEFVLKPYSRVELVPVLLLVEFVLKLCSRVQLVPVLLFGTSPTLPEDFNTNSTNSNTGTS